MEKEDQDSVVSPSAALPARRQARSATPSGEDEQARLRAMEDEANAFAFELLMPAEWIAADYAKAPFDIEDERALARMAKRYRVSIPVMTLRLGQVIWARHAEVAPEGASQPASTSQEGAHEACAASEKPTALKSPNPQAKTGGGG